MYKQLLAVFTVAVAANAAAFQAREDVTLEVTIPASYNANVTAFCAAWGQECIDVAHREGKAEYVCSAGYDGANSARVDCLAVDEPTATDYTQQIATDLGATLIE